MNDDTHRRGHEGEGASPDHVPGSSWDDEHPRRIDEVDVRAATNKDEALESLVASSDTGGRSPGRAVATLIAVTALAWSLFQLWIASPFSYTLGFGIFDTTESRSIHLAFAVFLAFLAFPPERSIAQLGLGIAVPVVLGILFMVGATGMLPVWYVPLVTLVVVACVVLPSHNDRVPPNDWFLAVAGALTALYLFLNYDNIATRVGAPNQLDFMVGTLGLMVLLEAARRSLGPALMVVATLFLVYTFLGQSMPDIIAHKGNSLSEVVNHQWITTEGVFGIALGVSTSFVFLFVLFGSLLDKAGAGAYFINVAFSLMGHMRGGPAKAARAKVRGFRGLEARQRADAAAALLAHAPARAGQHGDRARLPRQDGHEGLRRARRAEEILFGKGTVDHRAVRVEVALADAAHGAAHGPFARLTALLAHHGVEHVVGIGGFANELVGHVQRGHRGPGIVAPRPVEHRDLLFGRNAAELVAPVEGMAGLGEDDQRDRAQKRGAKRGCDGCGVHGMAPGGEWSRAPKTRPAFDAPLPLNLSPFPRHSVNRTARSRVKVNGGLPYGTRQRQRRKVLGQGRPSLQALRALRPSHGLAQEMGAQLGRSALLLQAMRR